MTIINKILFLFFIIFFIFIILSYIFMLPSKVAISIKLTGLCLMEHHLAFLPVTQAYSAEKCENQGILILLIIFNIYLQAVIQQCQNNLGYTIKLCVFTYSFNIFKNQI